MRAVAGLTVEELAERTGETVGCLEGWRSVGLLPPGARFGLDDAERVRLIRFLLRRGFDVDTIARAERHREGLLDGFLNDMFPSGRFPFSTLAEIAETAALPLSTARRAWEAAGFDEREAVGDDDVAMVAGLKIALEAGLPESALVELVRVYADALRRVAEAEVRLVHFQVHERLQAAGLPPDEVRHAVDAASEQLRGLIEPTLLYFHQKGWLSAVRDDLALHVAEEAGLSDVSEVPGTLSIAVVFADLARFTPLTEVMGDAVAADIVDRFSSIVRAAVRSCHGRIVKQMGDAYMLVFFEPNAAITCALEIEERAHSESHFPAVCMGAHWGPVLYREGDYVGATVNLASRLESEASPHQLLVSAELRDAAAGIRDVEFVPLGTRALKGMSGAVTVFEAHRCATPPREKLVDPVCGMELAPAEIVASLEVEGETQAFCSTDCLQRFVGATNQFSS